MKKFSVLALFVVLSMVLAACSAGSQNETPTAVGGLGPSTTEVPGEAFPTEALSTEMPTEPTGPVETMPAGTVVGTNIPTTGEDNLNHLKNLLGMNVIDSQNNDLGDVNDMIVDSTGSQIKFVVLGTGGFLGIGETNVLIPWEMFTLGADSNNNSAFIFNGNSDEIKNAPSFDLNNVDFSSSDWDMQFNDYWNNLGTGTGAPVAGTPVPELSVTELPTAVATPSNVTRGAAAKFVLASKLVIADVVDRVSFESGAAGTAEPGMTPNDQATASPLSDNSDMTIGTQVAGTGVAGADTDNVIGKVNDAIVDPQTGKVSYLVVEAADALNVGNKWIPVPLSQVEIVYKGDGDNNNILILVDSSRLSQAPNYDADALPDTSVEGWDDNLVTYWGITR